MQKSAQQNKKVLTLFSFFALTASMVMTIYEYPSFATARLAVIFFTIFGGIFWLLPTALIAAEMASVEGWSTGGVFGWVGHAFHNERIGFLAIFFQWFQITVDFITMSYFVIGMLSYVFNLPILNDNLFVKFLSVAVLFIIITVIQLGGTKYTAKIAQFGLLFGIIGVSLIFFALAIAYVWQGNHIYIKVGWRELLPNFHGRGTLTVFATFILAFSGIESSASHIDELQNPEDNYPLVMGILVVLSIVLNAAGGLSIAVVVPQSKLSLDGGIYQAFKLLLLHFNPHLTWLLDFFILMIVFGVIGGISSWVVGPSRGMQVAAEYGMLPPQLRKKNKHDVPVNIILIQTILVIMWDAILTFLGGKSNISFLIATSLGTLIYLLCYLLMYGAYFMLIFKHRDLPRTYTVPGGTIGKVIFWISGISTSIFAFIVTFTPSAVLPTNQARIYQIILAICLTMTIILAIIIVALQKFYNKNNPYPIKHF